MKSYKPDVSVIVAAYNQERFIGRCLRSLLHQTIPLAQYEVIVVDDGSTDRTAYALEQFCVPRGEETIKVLTNEKNMGLPAALNRGISAALGRYVIRVDSDDYVNANFLHMLQFYLDQNIEVDAVACDYLLVDDAENVLCRRNCLEHPIACGVMFRKEDLVEIGMYDELFRCHEDRELRVRFEEHHSVQRLPLPLYRYRRHEGNLTNDNVEMQRHLEMLVKKHGKNIRQEKND
jgi:glycosyltransferase involved in cell wall biosynthesis